MKKVLGDSKCIQALILVLLVTLILLCLTLSVRAETDVEFSGTLIAEPCQIDSDSEDMTIEFGAIAAKTFIDHTESAPKRFSFRLRECDPAISSQVIITFNGNSSSQNADYFAVNGVSENIALKIVDATGKIAKPGKKQEKRDLEKGDAEFQWQANVVRTSGDEITFGDFYSTVNIALEYP
ncbi:fimbrial protein [Pantoea ananatis]|jgi:type 1 fimbria pilin|uniref:Fimbrial protein n=2 Tax=Pantoea ananas TaxID=553 RepID=A0A8A4K3W9_PANAN|nr:fimbrial protein [Pantoea ananatis]MBN6028875.1 fimbrial protein [Pantoea ananatis]MDJ0032073.1 fimbrial protein [Pantoea ananatis]PXW04771.1 type 1 fimbria pilin [Pantoea ananatis]QTC45309.1 fimbrial protein [Pantoea ananatis]TDL59398.1 type 1 fimbrial protein [Pantoea ananatis]